MARRQSAGRACVRIWIWTLAPNAPSKSHWTRHCQPLEHCQGGPMVFEHHQIQALCNAWPGTSSHVPIARQSIDGSSSQASGSAGQDGLPEYCKQANKMYTEGKTFDYFYPDLVWFWFWPISSCAQELMIPGIMWSPKHWAPEYFQVWPRRPWSFGGEAQIPPGTQHPHIEPLTI